MTLYPKYDGKLPIDIVIAMRDELIEKHGPLFFNYYDGEGYKFHKWDTGEVPKNKPEGFGFDTGKR